MAKLELDIGQIVELLKQLSPDELKQVFRKFNVGKDDSVSSPVKGSWPYGVVLTDAAIGGGLSKPPIQGVSAISVDKTSKFSSDSSPEISSDNSPEIFSDSSSKFSLDSSPQFSLNNSPQLSSQVGGFGSDKLNINGFSGQSEPESESESEYKFTITSPINRLDMLNGDTSGVHDDQELDPEEALRLELNLTLDDEENDSQTGFSGEFEESLTESEPDISRGLNDSAEELIGKLKPAFGYSGGKFSLDPLAGLNFDSSPVESDPGYSVDSDPGGTGTEDPLAGLNFDSSPVDSHPGYSLDSDPGGTGTEDPLAGLNLDSSSLDSDPGSPLDSDPGYPVDSDPGYPVDSEPDLTGTEDPLAGLNFDSSHVDSEPGYRIDSEPDLTGTEDPLAGLNFDSSSVYSDPGSPVDRTRGSSVDSDPGSPVDTDPQVATLENSMVSFSDIESQVVIPDSHTFSENPYSAIDFGGSIEEESWSEPVVPVEELAPSIASINALAELDGLYKLFGKVREESGNLPEGRFRVAIAQAVCEIRGTVQPAVAGGSNRLDG
jgi:hypothetical protein